ncbi:MAG: hypothetical protein AAFW84_02470 [Cyanobacteria bacterium J06635_15]
MDGCGLTLPQDLTSGKPTLIADECIWVQVWRRTRTNNALIEVIVTKRSLPDTSLKQFIQCQTSTWIKIDAQTDIAIPGALKAKRVEGLVNIYEDPVPECNEHITVVYALNHQYELFTLAVRTLPQVAQGARAEIESWIASFRLDATKARRSAPFC